MKKYREIKRIIADELGFGTLAAYKRWIDEVRPSTRPTKESIEKLSPDNIDCHAFWQVCEDLFGLDPVFNVVVPPKAGSLPHRIEARMDANRMNLRLAASLGITAFLDEFADARLKTLEIGPGFGSLKNYIETHTKHIYVGIDVFPRIPDILETTREGLIPDGFLATERGSFGYIVSSNVFQHFSAKQRTIYFANAVELLREGGLFIFNMFVDTGKWPLCSIDENGNAWCFHYGQYTPVPRAGDLYEELASTFDILYVTQRYDALFNFVCQKRHAAPAPEASS